MKKKCVYVFVGLLILHLRFDWNMILVIHSLDFRTTCEPVQLSNTRDESDGNRIQDDSSGDKNTPISMTPLFISLFIHSFLNLFILSLFP